MSSKILLIDDDVDLVEMNRAFLKKNSFDVIMAYNGTDGFEKAKNEQPDLIVLDVMMTEVGEGFETARTLKGDEMTKDIPILMMTSVNQEHGFSLTVGPDETWNPVDAFVEKPFSPKELMSKIEEMI
jgi:two-component system alkaline phosphatase synthesis response regulator PhoP